jgi:hypothetical protein
MQYFGGKARLRDRIVPIINTIEGDFYVEPFCGACWFCRACLSSVLSFGDGSRVGAGARVVWFMSLFAL